MMNHAFAMVFTTLTIAGLPASGNEQVKPMTAKLPSSLEVSPIAAPFKNHWDSNSWERNSGDNFWHATSNTEVTATKKKAIAPIPSKSRVWTRKPTKSQN